MVFLALKDVYNDFHLKVVRILEWAVDRQMTHKTSMVILHDDEFCLELNKLQTICKNTPHFTSSLYGGNYFWNNATAAVGSQKKYGGILEIYTLLQW